MFQSSSIALFMYRYSVDHQGHYPTGKSSTEIFLKLLKGKYFNDPRLFFVPGTPGKTEPMVGSSFDPDNVNWDNILKPENVCYDVTIPIEADSPGDLPVVFLTGYKIKYSPGASATPLSSVMEASKPCMAVAYKNNTIARFQGGWFGSDYWSPAIRNGIFYNDPDPQRTKQGGRFLSDGTVTKFIPSTFDPAGKQYQQLTPDGILPP
jgi:hypothetical protein